EIESKDYAPLYEKLGVKNIVNPYLSTAAKILRLTHSESVVSLSFMKDVSAEAMEIIIPDSSKVDNKKVSEALLPRGLLIGSIVRNGQVIIPHGNTILKARDQLVVFAYRDVIDKIETIFS
ncbi:MAG TPA: Trk system potassium transporter TrkA, partial [Firmicutes bacterium]|nr:Trk system potassium transporter TrkA [Bacillota bacterium]